MTLLKQVSERVGENGKPFVNYYIAWRDRGAIHYVRVKPQFRREIGYMRKQAVEVPIGELFAKYVD